MKAPLLHLADRIAMAMPVGLLLAGSAGLTLVNRQSAPDLPTATLSQPAGSSMLTATAGSQAAAVSQDELVVGAARVPPRLDAVDPKTIEVPLNGPVVMSFSQPMNRHSVEASFTITPRAAGRFVWPDDLTLRFEPFRLEYATSYAVEVRGRSVRGVPLSGSRWWSFTTVPGPADVLAPGARSINVPILTYHYIRVNPDRYDRMGFALSVTPTDFAAQMDWLGGDGYHPITTEDLYAFLSGARGLPSKPVILTFDDGYADFYTTALPILRSHGFKAVAYIVSGFVDRPGYMTSAEIREADQSGIEIGSHTVNHPNLARMSLASVRAEVVGSKGYLEQLLGHSVTSFCYPSGKYTSAVAWEVAAAGYHDATTTRFGFSHMLGDRYAWTRLRVSGGEALDTFIVAVRTAS